ncbi:hypothetical protein JCM6882_001650 [Rhodosporidiobolus microsporus]
MQAIVSTTSPTTGRPLAALKTIPLPPPPPPDHLLIRTTAIALNAVDVRYAYNELVKHPSQSGRGCASLGRRIPNPAPGAFAEYILAQAATTFRIPDGVKDEEAAAVPANALTAAQFVVQLARASLPSSERLKILATASPKNHGLVRSLGADEVFDYRDPGWVSSVRRAAGGERGKGAVDLAFDCISDGRTVRQCAETMSQERGGKVAVVEMGFEREGIRQNVEVLMGVVWTAPLPANSTSLAFTSAFYSYIAPRNSSTFAHLRPPAVRLMPGGLERVVPDGFELFGAGRYRGEEEEGEKEEKRTEEYMRPVSAEKVVYRLS